MSIGDEGGLPVRGFPQSYQPRRDRSASPLKSRRNIRDWAAGVEQFSELAVIFIAPRRAGFGRQLRRALAPPHLVIDRGQSNVKRANYVYRLYRRARIQHLASSGIDTTCESLDDSSGRG